MALWENIVEAENVATNRKNRNPGVRRHIESRMKNLCEIQQMVLENRMRTGRYMHEDKMSGQDKLRHLGKLHFHPSHIEHILLTMAGDRRIERSLIHNTFASRKGYGQIACALAIKKNLRKYRGKVRWYAQGDIRKYYQSIRHSVVEDGLRHLFKDERFIRAYMEPFESYSDDGTAIPLGIRPSQSAGNLVLSPFDRFMTETLKCADYVRYLDDFMFTGATKGEVKWKMKRAEAYLSRMGFTLHVPKIHRIKEGIDMMGFVFRGVRNDMWWRKSNKVRWLRRRAKVSNPKRLRELDDAAWGMLKWGNSHCKRMWCIETGRKIKNGRMVKIGNCGIKRTERVDANGTPFFDAPKIGMQMLLGKPVESDKWIANIKTSQGEGRYAVRVSFMGDTYKLIVNAAEIKTFFADMTRNKVTRLKTMFIDRGSMHYGIDEDKTEIIEVDGRRITEKDGKVVFEDTGEPVTFV